MIHLAGEPDNNALKQTSRTVVVRASARPGCVRLAA